MREAQPRIRLGFVYEEEGKGLGEGLRSSERGLRLRSGHRLLVLLLVVFQQLSGDSFADVIGPHEIFVRASSLAIRIVGLLIKAPTEVFHMPP